jgi:hypothetical protein
VTHDWLISIIKDCPGGTIGGATGGRKKARQTFCRAFRDGEPEAAYFLTKLSASAQVGHFFGLQRLSFSKPHFVQFQTAMRRLLS